MSAYSSQYVKYNTCNKANSCRLPASNAIYSYQLPDNHATTQSTLCSVTSLMYYSDVKQKYASLFQQAVSVSDFFTNSECSDFLRESENLLSHSVST